MDKVLSKLKIKETPFTKPPKKQKVFNKVKNGVPPIANYNFEADLLFLPKTAEGQKYLLVVVDLANNKFDIEPIKQKTASACLTAYKEMLKRKFIAVPEISLKTDNGGEFQDEFNTFLKKHKILHLVSLPNRHKQMANVESLNRQLGKVFALYMNQQELETGEEYLEWTDIVDVLRKELNKVREIKLPAYKNWKLPVFNPTKAGTPKFKIGDFVYHKLEAPRNALNNRINDKKFREGDFRFSIVAKEIVKVIYMPDEPYYRYMLDGLKNVSYSENELILSDEKVRKYEVEKLLKSRKLKGKTQYLVRWKNYKVAEATWENEDQLKEDFGENHLKKLLENMKKH